uniref:CCHC-type domain-containing protein n=1 Tax=Setaria italica TaxID=4555 RepID=K4AMK3_SETIT
MSWWRTGSGSGWSGSSGGGRRPNQQGHIARNCTTPICSACREPGDIDTNCTTTICESCDAQGHIAGNCTAVCTRCNASGHSSAHCTAPVCTICQGPHWEVYCENGGPYRGIYLYGGDDACAHCGQRGHFNKQCPDVQEILRKSGRNRGGQS